MTSDAHIEAVRKVLGDDADIVAALLFGSAVRGHLRASSDLDLAVLYRDDDARRASKRHLFDRLGRLGLAAARDVHLIDLQSADCALRRSVFATGSRLFDRSGGALSRMERSTAVEYVDGEYARRVVDERLRQQLEHARG